ncbi:MAG: HAMP domain-containing sensor histidine kinase [Pseudomonadota bacterium]
MDTERHAHDLGPVHGNQVRLTHALIARDVMAHVTAHDMRTPLNTLSGLVQLLHLNIASGNPQKPLEYLEYMQRALHQMERIIARFPDHADETSVMLRNVPLDVRTHVEQALSTVRTPDCAALIDVLPTTCTVRGDPDLLHLLLLHLLRNALQHPHPDRPLEISVAVHAQGRLRITDTGTGFDPSARHAIFLPRAADPDTGRPAQLGLAVCKEVCRRHGWHLSATSDGQSGAVVNITFASTPVP